MASDAERLHTYEEDFREAGLPLFSEDISAAEDIWNRAAPLLGLVFLGEMLGAGNLDWNWWQNLLAVAGGLAILLVAIAVLNKLRGRSFSAIPRRLGKTELAAFVLVPAVLPLVFGGQFRSALVTAGANLLLLCLIHAMVGLGLVAIPRWVVFTDSTYREEFLDELTSEMRKSFEERAAYLKLRENQASG